MNNLRQMCAATILTLVLAVSVLAGQIECPTVKSPTTDGTSLASVTTTAILTIISLIR